MTDTASLSIRVESSDARTAARDLAALERAGRSAETGARDLSRQVDGAGASLRSMGVAAAAAFGAGAIVSEIFKVNREMQSLRTSLETVAGSQAGAAAQFQEIQKFAAATPYSVQQVTEAFIKLGNYGLKPSESALTSYGNTASAMGKSLNQMIEAVADAATGQFERLKEFGIKAAKEGDNVALTFHGVTTTVKNSADSITEYLQKIGNTDFAGGMERQAQTIDGALSTLGDSWSNLLDNVISPANERMIASLITGASDAINALGNVSNTMVTFGDTTASVGDYVESAWYLIRNTATDAIDTIASEFPIIGQVVQAFVVGAMESFGAAWRIVKDLAVIAFNGIVGHFNALGTAIGMGVAGIVEVFAQGFQRIKDMASGLALGIESAMAGDLSFSGLKAAAARDTLTFKQVYADVGAAVKQAYTTDYAAAFGEKVKSGAKDIFSLRTMIDSNNAAMIAGSKHAADHGAAHAAAADSVGKHGAAHKAASAATKDHNKALDDAKRLVESLMTPTEKFNADMEKAAAHYNAGRISLETFDRALAKHADELKNATANDLIAVTAQEKLAESYKKASDLFAAGKISQPGYAQMLNDASSTYTKAVTPAVDAEQFKALDEYNALLDKTNKNTERLGATNSAVFDGALGGINTLVGAFSEMIDAIDVATKSQEELNAKREAAAAITAPYADANKYTEALKAQNDYTKINAELESKKTQATLTGTRQIIGATANMFDQKSSGARALHALEQTIGAAQLAMNAAKMASDIATTGPAVASGVAQLFSQGGFAGFAAAGAFLALMGGLGFGGGGSTIDYAKQTQEKTGTGTVLGDASAKSESIAKSLEYLKNNSDETLPLSRSMLESLRNINSGISNLTAYGAQQGWFNSKNVTAGINTGKLGGSFNDIGDTLATGFLFGGVGLIASLFGFDLFGRDKSVSDYGITSNVPRGDWEKDALAPANRNGAFTDRGQTIADIMAGKLDLRSYTDTHVSDFWGSRNHREGTEKQMVSDALSMISKIIIEGANSIKQSAVALDPALKGITGKVDDFVFKLGDISFKGTDGKDRSAEDIQKDLNTAFGRSFDEMAKSLVPGLEQFQSIGEGYYQTLVRVSNQIESVQVDFKMVGATFAATGLDAAKFSNDLVQAAGDIGTLRDQFESFFSKFFTDGEQFGYRGSTIIANLSRMNMIMPATRDGWRSLVQQTLDAGTASANSAEQLLSLTDSADRYYKYLQDATDLFISLGEKLKGKTWSADFAYTVAKSITDNAIDAFNAKAGTKFDRGTIGDIYNDPAKIAALDKFVKNDPVLGGLAVDAWGAYNKELSAASALTQNQTDNQKRANVVSDNAAQIASQRTTLERQLLQASGNIAAIRAAELAALDPSNRALQQRIYDLQDSKEAEKSAAEAVKKHDDATAALNKTLESINTSYARLNATALESQLYSISDQYLSDIRAMVENGATLEQVAGVMDKALTTGARAFIAAADAVREKYKQIFAEISQRGNTISDQITTLTAPDQVAGIQRARALADLQSDNYQTQLSAVDRLFTLTMDGYSNQLDAVNKIKDASKNIAEYVSKFKLGNLSTLSPEARLAEARAQYAAQLAAAKAGDVTAMGNVTGAFDTYAQAAQSYYASSEPYQQIISQGMSELSKLSSAAADPTAATAENTAKTVESLRSLQSTLATITNNQTARLSADLNELQASTERLGGEFLQAIYSLGSKSGVSSSQINAALSTAQTINPAGTFQQFNDGSMSYTASSPATAVNAGMAAFADGNTQLAAFYAQSSGLFSASDVSTFLAQDPAKQISIINELRAQGKTFATGGIASQPSIFGEAGAEAAVPLPDGRRIPVELRGNAETVAELRAQRQQLADQVVLLQSIIAVLQDGFVKTVGENRKQNAALDDMSRRQRIAENVNG